MIELSLEPGWSYEEIRRLNEGVIFTCYDYARLLRQSQRISNENLLEWIKNYRPSFIKHDRLIFLEEAFSEARYRAMIAAGAEKKNAQLFINLVSVSTVLGENLLNQSESTAKEIARLWNDILVNVYPETTQKARVLYEEEDDEFFVTLDSEPG